MNYPEAVEAAKEIRKVASEDSIFGAMYRDGQGTNDEHDQTIVLTAEIITRAMLEREKRCREMLRALLQCPELNRDSDDMKPYTVAHIQQAESLLAEEMNERAGKP